MIAKDKIIEVATAIFSEKGITNTKVQEIATNAGVSKKTIYKFFEGKDELVRAVYFGLLEEMNRSMNELVSSDVTFVSKLVGIIRLLSERLQIITPTLINDLKVRNPNFSIFLEPYMANAVFDRFRKLLQTGVESGEVKSVVKLESVVLMYREAINGFIHMRSEANLPGGFSGGSALHVLCESLSTIFRGILSETALRDFDEQLKVVKF